MPRCLVGLLTVVLLGALSWADSAPPKPAEPKSVAPPQPKSETPAPKPEAPRPDPGKPAPPASPAAPKSEPPKVADAKMPLTNLAPSKITPDLCVLRYRVTTTSPECQAHFDQGLAWFYSYVWMEAARSFETATTLDPECAMAWWGLSRALEKWGRGKPDDAAKKAQDLSAKASPAEKMLITARMQERGLTNVPSGPTGTSQAEARRRAAAKTLDDLITLYDDDEEAWYYRAQIAGRQASIPYYKALLRINPLHPGANHELVHFYEANRRPALGWVYAENYVRSSPGIPHAFHMQAHLATRLGRWDKTSDRSARAIELQRAYHQFLNVPPGDDHQWTHHLEIGTLSLVHDGRFREARAVKEDAKKDKINQWGPWFRLHLAERDWDEAQKCVEQVRRTNKTQASYYAALLFLKKGDVARARAEVEVLLQAQVKKKNDRALEIQIWEAQGMLLCRSGGGDAGLQLIAKAVARTKDDYSHHAWGNGAYYMEAWGIEALRCNKMDVAEEAFLEALAHDPGSVRAALGLQVMCERLGRTEEASRYAELARRCWKRAEIQTFDAELAEMRRTGTELTTTNDTNKSK
jgi:tetratricopeptide (TPR) repeat protein